MQGPTTTSHAEAGASPNAAAVSRGHFVAWAGAPRTRNAGDNERDRGAGARGLSQSHERSVSLGCIRSNGKTGPWGSSLAPRAAAPFPSDPFWVIGPAGIDPNKAQDHEIRPQRRVGPVGCCAALDQEPAICASWRRCTPGSGWLPCPHRRRRRLVRLRSVVSSRWTGHDLPTTWLASHASRGVCLSPQRRCVLLPREAASVATPPRPPQRA